MSMAATSHSPRLRVNEANVRLAPTRYLETEIWGDDGTTPDPELRLRQGARMQRASLIGLSLENFIHWRGVRTGNVTEGAAGLAQPAVESGRSFDDNFVLSNAETCWSQAHDRSAGRVAQSLCGAAPGMATWLMTT